jgi:hypothetical protein
MSTRHNKFIIIILCLSTYYCFGNEAKPPRKNIILEEVNRLWLNREFRELEDYVHNLKRNFPEYIPTQLLYAEWLLYKGGDDLQSFIKELYKIDKHMQNYLPYFSPAFLSFIRGNINRANKSIIRHDKKGWTRSFKYEHFAPENLKKLREWTGLKSLYLFAPEITIPDRAGEKVTIHYKPELEISNMSKEEVRDLIANKKLQDTMKRADAIRYLEQQYPDENLDFLSQWMKSFFPEISFTAAEVVSGYGEKSIPVALDILQTPGLFTQTAVPDAVWVLLQNAPDAPETRQVLIELKEKHHPKTGIGIYVNRALKYVESNYKIPDIVMN